MSYVKYSDFQMAFDKLPCFEIWFICLDEQQISPKHINTAGALKG